MHDREQARVMLEEVMGFDNTVVMVALSSTTNFDDMEALVNLCVLVQEGGGAPALAPAAAPASVFYQQAPAQGMKMVLLVQNALKMSPGKVASQSVHAALGAVRTARMIDVEQWTGTAEKAVCLAVESEAAMQAMCAQARQLGLNVHECFDAGRTEVESGSRTVVAIGPHREDMIDPVTGHLRLY
jgi:peptidyl-tRNA hydrolase, PTH2 family